MAESDLHQPTHPQAMLDNERKLKYLDFVQVAAIYAIVCFTSVYEFAKDNAGPLKPGVQTVENAVKNVVGPVYEKFHDIPFQLFWFVDRKVDGSFSELNHHVPSLVKQASYQARAVATEVQRAGLVDAAKNITKDVTKYEPTAKELYSIYEPVAEHYAVSAWRIANRLPLFPQLTYIAVPTAAYWSEKYNRVVSYTWRMGFPMAAYMPLIPIDRIHKVFEDGPTRTSGATSSEGGSE